MKYMTMKKYVFNLQIFAGEENQDGTDPGEGDGQDESAPNDDQDEEDSTDEKKYSQKDVDEAVKKRLARERRKWLRKQESRSWKWFTAAYTPAPPQQRTMARMAAAFR